jgi:hypothetical protein
MRLKNILPTTLCVLALSTWALSTSASAGVYGSSSETSIATASDAALSSHSMLASSGFSPSFLSMHDAESGEELAQAVLTETDVPGTSLFSSEKKQQSLELNKQSAQDAAVQQQRAGFSLRGLFRGQGEPSLLVFFFCMAFIGLMIVGIRLEILRRRAEHAAFYDFEMAAQQSHQQQRHHRQKSTVIYVQTPSSTHRSAEQPRRHRRRRSSNSEGHSTHRRRHQSTHPVVIEGRLAS